MAAQLTQAKQAIRKEIKKKILSTYDAKKLLFESEFVANTIRKLPEYQSAKSLTCFVSMAQREVNTDLLLKYCFEDQKKVYLPRIVGDNLDEMVMLHTLSFEEIYNGQSFTKSQWGIYEPKLTYFESDIDEAKQQEMVKWRQNAMDTLDLDLLIIPGVAFNESNYRLGHGKGHYDRYLTKYKTKLQTAKEQKSFPYLIGIGLAANYHDNIPIEEHDWTLDRIVQFKPTSLSETCFGVL